MHHCLSFNLYLKSVLMLFQVNIINILIILLFAFESILDQIKRGVADVCVKVLLSIFQEIQLRRTFKWFLMYERKQVETSGQLQNILKICCFFKVRVLKCLSKDQKVVFDPINHEFDTRCHFCILKISKFTTSGRFLIKRNTNFGVISMKGVQFP